eukprot:1917060-Amphidinium_carterae.1
MWAHAAVRALQSNAIAEEFWSDNITRQVVRDAAAVAGSSSLLLVRLGEVMLLLKVCCLTDDYLKAIQTDLLSSSTQLVQCVFKGGSEENAAQVAIHRHPARASGVASESESRLAQRVVGSSSNDWLHHTQQAEVNTGLEGTMMFRLLLHMSCITNLGHLERCPPAWLDHSLGSA